MHSIGIDMSKDSFQAAFSDNQVKEFKNTEEGLAAYRSFLTENEFSPQRTVMGVESTGIYHLLFCAKLAGWGWRVRVINPLLTAQMIASGLRMVKTDRRDAFVIRQAVMLGKGYGFADTPEALALKALVSERDDLVKVRASLKVRLKVHGLRQQAAGMPLYDSYANTLAALSEDIRAIDRQLPKLMPAAQALLRSIPGIGRLAAALLVAFIGDIGRFSRPEQLVAYVGIDPRVKQSGTSVHGRGYITKRGSSLLRHVLFMSAFIAKRRNPAFAAYYQRKLCEGKHHTSIICALERKLIHCVWAVWQRGTPFQP